MRHLKIRHIVLSASVSIAIVNQTSIAFAKENLFPENLPSIETRPALSEPGSFAIGVTTIELTNKDQMLASNPLSTADRILELEVWYPLIEEPKKKTQAIYNDQTRSGQAFSVKGKAFRDASFSFGERTYPLVIFSHGYTGYRSLFFHLAEHLASHGYVVASIDHSDSTNKDVDFATSPGSGWPSTLLNRSRDQAFALGALFEHALFGPALAPKAALVGYSMGGYGALNTVGGCHRIASAFIEQAGYESDAAQALLNAINQCRAGRDKVDPRWQAMVAMAPWGGTSGAHDLASLENINLPTLFVGGEYDDVSGFENGMLPLYEAIGSKNKAFLIYENARHNIAGHPAPEAANALELDLGHYFEPAWDARQIAYINQHFLLAFLDCYVQKKEQACRYLPEREQALQSKDQTPWPGFADRWGLGLRFLRSDSVSAKKLDSLENE